MSHYEDKNNSINQRKRRSIHVLLNDSEVTIINFPTRPFRKQMHHRIMLLQCIGDDVLSKHLSQLERDELAILQAEKWSFSATGKKLGRHNITLNNDIEFKYHEKLKKQLNVDTYFLPPVSLVGGRFSGTS